MEGADVRTRERWRQRAARAATRGLPPPPGGSEAQREIPRSIAHVGASRAGARLWLCSGSVGVLAWIVSRAVWVCETTLGSGPDAAVQSHGVGALRTPRAGCLVNELRTPVEQPQHEPCWGFVLPCWRRMIGAVNRLSIRCRDGRCTVNGL
jgi:hypothetical protein